MAEENGLPPHEDHVTTGVAPRLMAVVERYKGLSKKTFVFISLH